VIRWQKFQTGHRHLRQECGNCGAFLRYAPQTSENLEAAEALAGGQRAEDVTRALTVGEAEDLARRLRWLASLLEQQAAAEHGGKVGA
jgi:hypothetical protein